MDYFLPQAEYLLLYDDQCPVCRRSVSFIQRQKGAERLQSEPLQRSEILEFFGVSEQAALKEIHVVNRVGEIKKGADGVIWALGALPHWRWLNVAKRLPGFTPVSRSVYRTIASRRQREVCNEHTCG